MVVALEKLIQRGSLETEPAVVALLAEERARAERFAAAAGSLTLSMKIEHLHVFSITG